MHTIICLLLLAQAQGSTLDPNKLDVDSWGPFPKQNDAYYFRISSVIDEKRMLVARGSTPLFVVEGIDTKKLFDGRRVPLEGIFKVTKTAKVGGRTYPVVEPFNPDAKKK